VQPTALETGHPVGKFAAVMMSLLRSTGHPGVSISVPRGLRETDGPVALAAMWHTPVVRSHYLNIGTRP